MLIRKPNDGRLRPPVVFLLVSLAALAVGSVGLSRAAAQPIPPSDDPGDEARRNAALQARAAKYFNDGQQLLAEDKIGRAKTKFKSAIGLVGLEGVGQSAFAALRQIHTRGMSELERVKALVEENKLVEALDLARATRSIYANLFGGLNIHHNLPNISRLARNLEEQLEKHPATRVQIQERRAAPKMRRIRVLEKASNNDPTRYYDLFKAYRRIVRAFPDCPTGQDCAAKMETLRSDKKIWRMINDERKCRWIENKLDTIKKHEANGMPEKARETLKELVARFGERSPAEFRQLVAEKRPKPEKKEARDDKD